MAVTRPASRAPRPSLGLLHRPSYDLDAEILRGKTVAIEVVQRVLDQGGLLGPDTCGWHYAEGLTQNDDRRLALLWDKVGLGHNGERYPDGSRQVVFVGCEVRMVSGAEWPKFLEEQRELLSKRDAAAVRGGPVAGDQGQDYAVEGRLVAVTGEDHRCNGPASLRALLAAVEVLAGLSGRPADETDRATPA